MQHIIPNALHWMKSVDGKSQPVFGGKFFLFLWDSVWTKHRVVEIGLLLKKSKQGGTVVKDIYRISRGIQESARGIFRSYVKKHRISIVEQEKFMWNFLESCFLALKLARDVTYIMLPNFQGWGFVLPETSRGTEKNQKTSRVSFKKVCPDPPFVFFLEWLIRKQLTWICPIRHLPRKKHWPYIKIGHLHRFHVFNYYHQFYKGSHICIVISAHWGRGALAYWEIKPTPSSSSAFSQYICLLVNIISKGGKKPQPYSILRTVFKWYWNQDFEKSMAFFSCYFWKYPLLLFVWLTLSVKWKMLR